MKNKRFMLVLLALGLFCLNTYAQDDCRYHELNGLKGAALRQGLQAIIANHTVLTYSQVRADKAKVDLDENQQVLDMYSSCTFDKTAHCGSGTDFPACDCYNREHSLPKSFWGGSQDEPMYTDLHHVIPTDFVANSQRSAWIYDEVKSASWTNGVSKLGTSKNFSGETAFEPADEYKGDIARIYFYMLTCYRDKNFTQGGRGKIYFSYSGGEANFTSKAITLLLKWHRNDPVSQKEIDRNEKVAKFQGNRNPFVDEPDLAEYIWGTSGQAYTCNSQAFESVETPADTRVIKRIENGRLVIIVDGVKYNAVGQRIE